MTWRDQALCATVEYPSEKARNRVWFPYAEYPRHGTRAQREEVYDQARTICNQCPVKGACRKWILTVSSTDDVIGMVAGMSPRERMNARRTLRRRSRTKVA